MKKTFKGGVHLLEENFLVSSKTIVDMPLCPIYVLPVHQHVGTPCKPIVRQGDVVKKGQQIAEPAGYVSVAIHAPTSGKIKEIGPKIHPLTGRKSLSVVIESDGKDEWVDGLPLNRDPFSIGREKLVTMIQSSGIVGLGGATFPTHVKLSPSKEKKIDTLIINGVECDSHVADDHRLMVEHPEAVISGAKVIMSILGLNRSIIAIGKNKPDAIAIIREKVPPEIQLEPLEVKYPQGAERQLIKTLTGRDTPSGGLPMDIGCLVHNAGTCAAIWNAAAYGIPLIERITSVTGHGIVEPKNIRVKIGTLLKDVIEFCGGIKNPAKILFGGPMMGIAQYSLDVPVIKGTSGIVVLTQDEVSKSSYTACIACGRCVDFCPMQLNPSMLSRLGEKSMWEKALNFNLLDCIECGVCSYICPSNRPIKHFIRHLKTLEREAKSLYGK
jgi:electron transport complex protein RnfC